MGHGHVKPNPDGSRARCGGPGLCGECSTEKAAFENSKLMATTDSIQVGDEVRFYPVVGRRIYETRVVREVLPDGIPSLREPMLMLEGKPGVVLASHCKLVRKQPSGGGR